MRRDIQFLRGVAVLVVVLYHSNLGLFSQGYLGVDVFFVISGFLITTIILKSMDNNSFSFSEFYLRRAKRLLPALYSTLIITTFLSLIVLTEKQWIEYLDQLKGALTFSANMVLPSQTGYFESVSEGKPLLHIWSLSLEEQYYFLLPISLFLLPKNYRLIGLMLLTFASLFWCFTWVYSASQEVPFLWRIADASKSEWAFYLLFPRAWELLGGSLCAWIVLNRPPIKVPIFLKVISLALIFLICTVNVNNEHPSVESFIVVLCTITILIGSNNWLPNNFIVQLVEKMGDWSYSIYLVHWPLFAFAYLSFVGNVPIGIKIILIFSSVLLGFMQFKYIEAPFRSGKLKKIFSTWKVIISTTAIFLCVPITSAYTASNAEDEFSEIRRVNTGLGKECDGSFNKESQLKSICSTDAEPKLVVWGDSYAMHLVAGLSIKNKELAQVTKSSCGPVLGIAPIRGKYDSVWAEKCLQFNNDAFEYIKNHPSITHVVLSANFGEYSGFNSGDYLTYQGSMKAGDRIFASAFENTILDLIKLNITPIVVSPPPKAGFDVGECLERKYGGALLLRESCNIKYLAYQDYQQFEIEALKKIEKIANVIWLENYLCENETCNVYIDGVFIYRDSGHLSVDGSIKLFRALDVNDVKAANET